VAQANEHDSKVEADHLWRIYNLRAEFALRRGDANISALCREWADRVLPLGTSFVQMKISELPKGIEIALFDCGSGSLIYSFCFVSALAPISNNVDELTV
jgi:hypothetical protein